MNRKRLLSLMLALLLTAGSAVTVQAQVREGSDGWNVRFTGNKMESNFTNAAIADKVYEMQPGDTVNFTVDLKNDSDITTDWYMTNKVLKSLENSQSVAEGGAYTYVLTYVDSKNKKTTLYSNATVGGDEKSAKGTTSEREGLYEATDSLEKYIYLDTLSSGQPGTVNLSVSLDGETQGNAYQDTLADLQMNFAVERTDTTTRTANRDDGDKEPEKEVVKTGDDHGLFLWSMIAMGSGLLFLLLAILKRRKDRRAES